MVSEVYLLSAGSVAFTLVGSQKYHGKGYGRGRLLTSWWPGRREGGSERRRERLAIRVSL